MKLIWHADGLLERDWIRDILGDLVDEEIRDLDLQCIDDDSVHVVSSNRFPLPAYEAYFKRCRESCTHIVLVHLSDEWFSGGYGLYRYFDAVIRNFGTYLAQHAGILTIPEGYPNGTSNSGALLPADQRRYAWSFVGEIKASRVEMAAAFAGFEPQLITHTESISKPDRKVLSKPEFDAILGQTVFSPCPMGNAILETWRLYESLELGCIPLTESRLSLDYFNELFGPNPIPKFSSWTRARHYAEETFMDKSKLLALQGEIATWWSGHKDKVRSQVKMLLNSPSYTAELGRFGDLTRNRIPLLYEPNRLIELLRHQNRHSLRRRLSRPGAPIKRIISDSFRRLGV